MGRLREILATLGWQVIIVYILAQAFYLMTLAPTVLWGDDAKFQRQAYVLDLQAQHAWDHPLWVLIAHPFTRLPIGDPAFRVNLFTSLWAAVAIAFVFASLRVVTKSTWAGAIGAVSLLVSHTFWTHAVRAEVYSLNMALLAISLYCLVRSNLSWRNLLVSAIAAGLAVDNHVMMWLVIPGLGVLAIWRVFKEKVSLWELMPAIIGFVLSVGLYRLLLTPRAAIDLEPVAYIPSLKVFAVGTVTLVVYLILQFPSPALVLAFAGARRSFRERPLGICLILIALANIAAVVKFTVRDTYVFYMLVYFTCAFWIGLGYKPVVEWLSSKLSLKPGSISTAVFLGVLIIPILAYSVMPALLPKLGITNEHLNIREIHGRPALKFFLFPPKRNHFGARHFAETALSQLPPDAVIIADHTLQQPMLYLQTVENHRPDVDVVELFMHEQVSFALAQSPERPVFLAETEPYYDIDGLAKHFRILPEGIIYRLEQIPDE